jgi:hypothetical protein
MTLREIARARLRAATEATEATDATDATGGTNPGDATER